MLEPPKTAEQCQDIGIRKCVLFSLFLNRAGPIIWNLLLDRESLDLNVSGHKTSVCQYLIFTHLLLSKRGNIDILHEQGHLEDAPADSDSVPVSKAVACSFD